MKHVPHGISELTLTDLLALTYEDVIARVQSGEWGIEQFTQWSEDRINHAYGDGYDEGWDTSEESHIKK